jgi:hypothetical protein
MLASNNCPFCEFAPPAPGEWPAQACVRPIRTGYAYEPNLGPTRLEPLSRTYLQRSGKLRPSPKSEAAQWTTRTGRLDTKCGIRDTARRPGFMRPKRQRCAALAEESFHTFGIASPRQKLVGEQKDFSVEAPAGNRPTPLTLTRDAPPSALGSPGPAPMNYSPHISVRRFGLPTLMMALSGTPSPTVPNLWPNIARPSLPTSLEIATPVGGLVSQHGTSTGSATSQGRWSLGMLFPRSQAAGTVFPISISKQRVAELAARGVPPRPLSSHAKLDILWVLPG